MKALIFSQFGYCPLIWIFRNKKLNSRVNNIHEGALQIVYRDRITYFEEQLKKDKSVTIHQRNLQILPTEFKDKKWIESKNCVN